MLIQNSSIEVPVALLFGTQDSPDEYNIPGRQLEQLPPECLAKILEEGQTLNTGTGLSVCRLGATESVESLLRVKQYLAHGDYLPFKPSMPLQIVDAAGIISEWSSLSTRADNVHTTDATFDLFVKEMRLYAFAADHSYTELREFSSKKLRTGYPVLAMETLALLEHLYILAEILQDQELLTFMKESSESHRDGLIRQPRFLTILRQSVGHHNPLGQVLLEVQIAASQQQQVELFLERQLIKPEPQAQPLSIITQPTDGLLAQIHEVLIKERLVVAKRDGYGTLLGQPGGYVRNRDFTFEENELLLADYSKEPFNGRKNITVENAKGQRGDILGSLVWAVPAGLGTVRK